METKAHKTKELINMFCIIIFSVCFCTAAEGAVRQKKKSSRTQTERPIFECSRKVRARQYLWKYWNYPTIDRNCEYAGYRTADFKC